MVANIQNGGLVANIGDHLWISDIKRYQGIYELPSNGSIHAGPFWFMNVDKDFVYYSDQKKGHVLCRMGIESRIHEVILKKPCYGLVIEQDWIYFIHEDDRKLYRCTTNGDQEKKIIDEHVVCFYIRGDYLFYSTGKGIYRSNLEGLEKDLITNASAIQMIPIGHMIAYADRQKQQVLTIYDPTTDDLNVYDDIQVTSMNTDGKYIYCANHSNYRGIYRVDPERGNQIRICGDSAHYLHIINDTMYFCTDREWYTISLSGGEAMKLHFDVR